MKKFKIIEGSRFLISKESKNIHGGGTGQTTICTDANSYRHCPYVGAYTSCGAGVVAGYSAGPDGESCGGTAIKYSSTNCGGVGKYSSTCGGSNWYRI